MSDKRLRAALTAVAHDPLGCNGLHVELESAIRAATPDPAPEVAIGHIDGAHNHNAAPVCRICGTALGLWPQTATPDPAAAGLDVERLRVKAADMRSQTQRMAISAEDWRYLNGYEAALRDAGILPPPEYARLSEAER